MDLGDPSADVWSTSSVGQAAWGKDDVTMEFWVRLDALGTSQRVMDYTAVVYNAGSPWWALDIAADGRLTLGISMGSQSALSGGTMSTSALTTGVWTHVAVVFSPSVGKTYYYFDGVDAGSAVIPSTFMNAWTNSVSGMTSATTLGFSHSSLTFNGSLDAVRLWRTARTWGQINANLCSSLYGDETDLALWFPFESDEDDHGPDAVPFDVHGSTALGVH